MDDAPTEAPARPQTVCPTCRAPAERGQLVCLECGSRIALSYRRPPSWKIPVAISAVLLLLAGAGAVLAYQEIGDEAEREVAATPVKVSDRAAEAQSSAATTDDEPATTEGSAGADEPEATATGEAREPQATAPDEPEPDRGTASDGLVKDGALYTWPPNLESFTVVLLSNEDRQSALSFADSAAKTRDEKIGVIRSNDFETLPTGFFIVFAGRYSNRAKADAAATRLGRTFRGAFPQVVRR
jgi:septal ring-binding cell division protein DamX